MLSRFFPLLAVFVLVGCSQSPAPATAPEANKPPELSSTIDKPEETKLDQTTSLTELEAKHKLKAYAGAKELSAEVFKRGDGGTKFVVFFTTADDTKKVTDFYKAELGDGKVDAKGVGTSMGMTKADASVIAITEPADKGSKVKITLISYSKS